MNGTSYFCGSILVYIDCRSKELPMSFFKNKIIFMLNFIEIGGTVYNFSIDLQINK